MAVQTVGGYSVQPSGDLPLPDRQNPVTPTTEPPPAGVSPDWWSQVQEDITREEYYVTWQERTYLSDLPAAYHGPNRAQNLRTYFTPTGIRVTRRTAAKPGWELGMHLVSYGREGDAQPVAEAELSAAGNGIAYDRGAGLAEWYVNGELGLEQGFTLNPAASLPSSSDPLVLEMAISGNLTANASADGTGIEFTTPGGVRVLRYGDLHAYDADGREVPAQLVPLAAGEEVSVPVKREGIDGEHVLDEVEKLALSTRTETEGRVRIDGIRLVVDDTAAVYPITVDPLLSSPGWTAESDQAYAYFGFSVSEAGDVNGDGYGDVVVGAPYYDGGQTNEGRAYVYTGTVDGLSTTPDWTAESDQDSARFGYAVSAAGDVNDDDYGDVIVGAHGYGNGEAYEGRAYVYHGAADELSATPDWTAESDQAYAYFGYSVSTAGDVNDDGYADVIVGAPYYDGGQASEGRAFVYTGTVEGPSVTPDWTAESDQVNGYFGRSVSTAGDVNDDGYGDVIVGAHGYGDGDVYGQRVTETGGLAGANVAIATPTGSDQLRPRVAAAGTAGYLAVWEDRRNDSLGDIYGQIITASGVLSGSNFVIGATNQEQDDPDVAYNPDDDLYLVVWRDERNDSYGDIYGQLVSAAGVLSGSNFVVSAYGSRYQGQTSVVYDQASGEFLVVWTQYQSANNNDIYGQRLSGRGVLLDNAGTPADESDTTISFAISTEGSHQAYPGVSADGAGGNYLAVWQDWRNYGSAAYDIYGQIITASGGLSGTNFALASNTAYQYNPAVAGLAGGQGFLSIWNDYRSGGDLYGQRTSSGGTLIGSNQLLVDGVGWMDGLALAAHADTPEALLTWEWDDEIYAQRYGVLVADFEGAPLAGSVPLTVTFTNLSAPATEVETVTWDFGDGVTSTLEDPSHVYTATGIYTVSLTAVWGDESDTLTRTNYITAGSLTVVAIGAVPAVTPTAQIGPDGVISATFSRAIDAATISTRTFTVYGQQTGIYTGIYTVTGASVQFDAAGPFKPGELLLVDLNSGIRSLEGISLTPYVRQFRTVVSGGSGYLEDNEQRLGSGSEQRSGSRGWGTSDVALGDLDGDDDLDAFVTKQGLGNHGVEIWLNQGSGTFTTSQQMGDDVVAAVALGDVDRDGDLDGFVGTSEGGRVYLNDGTGTFTTGAQLGERYVNEVALGDVDGDGYLDALAASSEYEFPVESEGNVESWLNDGTGTFTVGQVLTDVSGAAGGVTLGDVDGDGDLDVFFGGFYDDVNEGGHVWLNDGSVFTDTGQKMGDYWTTRLTLGDVDGDDDLDALADSEVWLNDGSGVFTETTENLVYSFRALGDLDGDGDLDAVTERSVETNNGIQVWANDGAGAFTALGEVVGPMETNVTAVALGDVDNDGDLDAFATYSLQSSQIWLTLFNQDKVYTFTTCTITYTYDPLYRLTNANYSTGESFAYQYDAVGNRTAMTSVTPLSGTLVTTYTYDVTNRLTDREVSDGRAYTYTWSARGQMLAEYTQGIPVRTFTYDGAGRMVEATLFTLTTVFTYNGLGARVAVEVVGQGVTTYVVDYAGGHRILAEQTLTGTTLYLYGRECLGQNADDEWLYYLADGTGYVRQTTDEQGQLAVTWLFDPDGAVLEGPEGPVTHLVCSGVYDWSTGLISKDGRYFDPILGIWLALMPLVVVQSWRGRKRKRRGFPWYVLVLLVVCVSGTLTACGNGQLTPEDFEALCVDVPELESLSVTVRVPQMGYLPLQAEEGADEEDIWFVSLGQVVGDWRMAGAMFKGDVSVPEGTEGYMEYVQNYTSRITLTWEDGSSSIESTPGWSLDGADPYFTWANSPLAEHDNPPCSSGVCTRFALDTPSMFLNTWENNQGLPVVKVERTDNFRMFLMWRPLQGLRCPLGVVEWSWMIVAERAATDTSEVRWDRLAWSPPDTIEEEGTSTSEMPVLISYDMCQAMTKYDPKGYLQCNGS